MVEEPAEEPQPGQERDKQGRFTPQPKPDDKGQSSPQSSDYTKMNSYLAKQLGLTGKLADYQTQYEPRVLFDKLSFMADNTDIKPGTESKPLPDNQPIAPITPEPQKYELPGVQLSKPNLTQENFSVHYKIDPRDLFQPKKKDKK